MDSPCTVLRRRTVAKKKQQVCMCGNDDRNYPTTATELHVT